MEPRIQYATAADGVSVAYWSMGQGVPLIHMPPAPWSHLLAEWADPAYRHWFERLASVCHLVKYDNRGSGLSDRDAGELSLEAMMMDIDAVADRLGFEQFALCGVSPSGPVAIAYAATRPERVSHLLLWCSPADGHEMETPEMAALNLLAETNWNTFTETIGRAMVAGWAAPEQGHAFAHVMREAVGPRDIDELYPRWDARPFLPQVKVPTLVLHRRDVPMPPAASARRLAAGIADAQLVLLEGGAVLPFVGDTDSVHREIESFLGLAASQPVDRELPSRAQQPTSAGLCIILFTDLEGHTTMMQHLGDQKGREVLRAHERITRQALRDYGGSEVKSMGDGFMASFVSAQKALDCAVALARAFDQHNARSPEAPLHVRVGLNAGEPIAEEGDLFGSAVILAARIAGTASGGQVLVANVVRELVAGKGFLFADRGETSLRGFEDPVRLYELRWSDER